MIYDHVISVFLKGSKIASDVTDNNVKEIRAALHEEEKKSRQKL